MTEQDVRALGLSQINAGLLLSAFYAQNFRREALAALLAAAGQNQAARAAIIQACRQHPDARWWLLRKRKWGVPALEHWTRVFGKEVSRALVECSPAA